MYDSLIRLLSACLFQIIFKNNNCFIWGKPTQQEWKIEEAQSILYMEKLNNKKTNLLSWFDIFGACPQKPSINIYCFK